jgi:hypothetical protein
MLIKQEKGQPAKAEETKKKVEKFDGEDGSQTFFWAPSGGIIST